MEGAFKVLYTLLVLVVWGAMGYGLLTGGLGAAGIIATVIVSIVCVLYLMLAWAD